MGHFIHQMAMIENYINFPEKRLVSRCDIVRYINEEFESTYDKAAVYNNVCLRLNYPKISKTIFESWYVLFETNSTVLEKKIGRLYFDLLSDLLSVFHRILTDLIEHELEKPITREVVFSEVCRKLDYPDLSSSIIAESFRLYHETGDATTLIDFFGMDNFCVLKRIASAYPYYNNVILYRSQFGISGSSVLFPCDPGYRVQRTSTLEDRFGIGCFFIVDMYFEKKEYLKITDCPAKFTNFGYVDARIIDSFHIVFVLKNPKSSERVCLLGKINYEKWTCSILHYAFTTEFGDFTTLSNDDKFLTIFLTKNQKNLHLFVGNLKKRKFGNEHRVQLEDTYYNCFKLENNSLYGLQTIGEIRQNPTGIGFWEMEFKPNGECVGPFRLFKFILDGKIKLNDFKFECYAWYGHICYVKLNDMNGFHNIWAFDTVRQTCYMVKFLNDAIVENLYIIDQHYLVLTSHGTYYRFSLNVPEKLEDIILFYIRRRKNQKPKDPLFRYISEYVPQIRKLQPFAISNL